MAGRPTGALEPAQVRLQQDFAVLLAEGLKTSEAARKLDIPPSTAFRWAKEPAVTEYIAQAQAEVRNSLVRDLYRLGRKSIAVIEAALDGDEISPTRHKAATDTLDRIGVSRQEIVKHIGSAEEPVVIEFNIPVNPNAQAEQEERRRRRAAKQAEVVVEGEFEVKA